MQSSPAQNPDSGPTPAEAPENGQIAALLDEVAQLLEAQGANPYRVRAYRRAAGTIRELKQPLRQLAESGGETRLTQLPGIGPSLCQSLTHILHTGRLPLLERLRGANDPETLFTTVADIGPKLAERIHEQLGIESLGELAAASLDGRLSRVPGMGPKRVRAVRESLAGRFRGLPSRVEPSAAEVAAEPWVPVAELLDVDREYREAARHGRLPRIAPRQFNPTSEAWLPILHTERHDRHYTALFSNTSRAHELGATHDWVVIYRDDEAHRGCWTVITSTFGRLRGRRIVRGREPECSEFYAAEGLDQPPRRQQELPF
jgi:predicted flap endonuclease-1-like 5' DNA nuclease